MKNSKAEELMKGFPKLSNKLRDEMYRSIQGWIVCDGEEAHCTSCKGTFPDKKDYYRHRKNRRCPLCLKNGIILRNYYNFNGVTLEAEDNIMVFQSSKKDDNLYVGCYNFQQHMYKDELCPRVTVTETQRYIFSDKRAFRFGRNKEWESFIISDRKYWTSKLSEEWHLRSKVTEPQFKRPGYSAYCVIGYSNVKNTCMKHSELEDYPGSCLIEYLRFYQKHTGAERLIKAGFGFLVEKSVPHIYSGYYGYYNGSRYDLPDIDWKQTEIHKMLGVTKDAVDPIRKGRIQLKNYKVWRERYPNKPIDKLIEYNILAGLHDTYDNLDKVIGLTGLDIDKVAKYIKKTGIDFNTSGLRDYFDYISDCVKLRYDTKDKSINRPRDFYAAHDRVSKLRAMIEDPEAYVIINGRADLEFECGDYVVISPKTKADIVEEGKVLSHCVGGYADRHASGKLSIMFLRRKDEPDKPYYTIEVGNDCIIKQCRGYKNNVVSAGGCEKPEEIKEFEKLYQDHLMEVYAKRAKEAIKSKNNRRKTA